MFANKYFKYNPEIDIKIVQMVSEKKIPLKQFLKGFNSLGSFLPLFTSYE